MEANEERAAMASAGVPAAHYEQCKQIQEASGLDWTTVLTFFTKYGVTLFQILVDLGFIKPNPTPPA